MDKVVFFFGGIEPIIRILVVGTLAYISLVILLRVSGKRTLSRMNAFDFVITVALGSTFGRLITAKTVSLAESITAFFLLIFLQYLVSWLTVRSSRFKQIVTASPSLLYFRGQFLDKTMKQQRVTQPELLAIVRQNRIGSLEDVEAIVMESAGTFAVIKKSNTQDIRNHSSLANVLPDSSKSYLQ
ncbi:protein of unknown function DUF421 [Gloeothece citriformis PCC 7424]|uniref:DUF421 domain-containing protein n=1 Tax=Gloeothece citriformis (strain PCC 7424) TaxID=65393 RepID=B7K7J2_GLOC7|nr:YetF domain-containing protein [Gloeothece citriformis]ACK69760.1 protein of unknown function DUF421 [Gloeothece citriformis PCC 7424]